MILKMKCLQSVLVASWVLMAAPAVWAQGAGVSGPDRNGVKTSTDEAVLTAKAFKSIVGSCYQVELEELYRILTKRHQSEVAHVKTELHSPKGDYLDAVRVVVEMQSHDFVDLERIRGTSYGNFRIVLGVSGWSYPYLNLDLLYVPTLSYQLSEAAEGYDEYGRIIDDRMIVSSVHWKEYGDNLNRGPLVTLLNGDTGAPIKGATFNFGRLQSCINLKLGKYVPKN